MRADGVDLVYGPHAAKSDNCPQRQPVVSEGAVSDQGLLNSVAGVITQKMSVM